MSSAAPLSTCRPDGRNYGREKETLPDLRIRDLSKTYPNGVHALQRVNLTESTLMRTIATLQEPDEGEIHLGALDVLRQKDEVRRPAGTCRRSSASIRRPRRSGC
jgi:hypothetical protein